MHTRSSRLLALLCVLGSTSAPSAFAADEWTQPFGGIRYLHRTTDNPKFDIHLVFADLTEPGVRFVVSSPAEDKATVSRFAKKRGLQIATNGDFNTERGGSIPRGLTISGGKKWPEGEDDPQNTTIAYGAGGRMEYFPGPLVVKPEAWMTDVIGGHPDMIVAGQPVENMKADALMNARHPRTATGLSKDRKTLMLLVVDGRQKHSIGMTGKDMTALFQEFGAWWAVNQDGGGSSAIYLEGQGILNKPSDGRERPVVNYQGIAAPKGAGHAKGQVKGYVKADGKPVAGAKVALSSAYFDVTTAEGYFHLSQVPAGSASLSVTADGFAPEKAAVKVEANAAAETTVELKPKTP